MITAEHELARDGSGERFHDSVSIDFCDGERDLFGLAWITRMPNAACTRANAVIFADGELVERLELEREQAIEEWRLADLEGIAIATVTPLERWSLEMSGDASSLKLDAAAVSPPAELAGADVAESTGISQYEQLCELNGAVSVGGRTHPVRCAGRRVHAWGEFAWERVDRWRSFYAASAAGRAISVTAARPVRSAGHGEELRAASLIGEADAEPFESVRISTVWGAEGLPAKAGLELAMPGDEIPRRLGGEAICGMRTERGDHALALSFFRWSMEGVPAWGCYESVQRT
jgi:hypothetical protein